MSIQTVWLHVGHGKTGSSFIQSALAASIPKLVEAGFHYPIQPLSYKNALRGHISSGNMRSVNGALAKLLSIDPVPADKTDVLLSNETLSSSLFGAERIIDEMKEAFPGAQFKVLLFIRDPLDHMISGYHQAVKRAGSLDHLGGFSQRYQTPERIGEFLDAAAREGFEMTIHNYSRHARNLLPLVERWLGLAPDALVRPPVEWVNRSMTNAELELQRAFSRHLGPEASRLISDPLCNLLPDIRSEKPTIPAEDLREFLDRMTKMVADLNGRLPADEGYRVGTVEDHVELIADETGTEPQYTFSAAQIEIIATTLSARITALEGRVQRLRARKASGAASAPQEDRKTPAKGKAPPERLSREERLARREKREQREKRVLKDDTGRQPERRRVREAARGNKD